MSFGPASAALEEGIFAAARIIYQSAQNQLGEVKVESYRRVRSLLDQILSDHPETDLATRILLQDTIDGVDVLELDGFFG